MSFKDYSQKMYDWLTGNLRPNVIPIDANGNEKFTPANPGVVSLLGTAAVLLKGIATGGTETTIVDNTKDFDMSALANRVAKVTIGGIEYYRAITACAGDTITIATIQDAAGAIAMVGSGEDAEGKVSIHCKGDLIGGVGNDYSVQIVQGTATTGDDVVTIDEENKILLITVNLDGSSNPRTLAAGGLQTLLANTVDIADKFEIPGGFTAGNLPIGGDAIPFVGGVDAIAVPVGAPYEVLLG